MRYLEVFFAGLHSHRGVRLSVAGPGPVGRARKRTTVCSIIIIIILIIVISINMIILLWTKFVLCGKVRVLSTLSKQQMMPILQSSSHCEH